MACLSKLIVQINEPSNNILATNKCQLPQNIYTKKVSKITILERLIYTSISSLGSSSLCQLLQAMNYICLPNVNALDFFIALSFKRSCIVGKLVNPQNRRGPKWNSHLLIALPVLCKVAEANHFDTNTKSTSNKSLYSL